MSFNLSDSKFPLEELPELLRYLPYSDREVWWKTFAICGRYFNRDERAFNMLCQWSHQYPDRKSSDNSQERTEFYVSSYRDGAGIGTLIEMAKAAGYKQNYRANDQKPNTFTQAKNDLDSRFIVRKDDVELHGFGEMFEDMSVLGSTIIVYLLSVAKDSERAAIFAHYANYAQFFPERQGQVFEALCSYSRNNQGQFTALGFRDYLLQTKAIIGFTCDEYNSIIFKAKTCTYNSCIDFLKIMKVKYTKLAFNNALLDLVEMNRQDDGLSAINELGNIYHKFSRSEEFAIMDAAELGFEEQDSVLDLADPEARKKKFLPSGFREIDDKVWGFKLRELTYIAGHSGVGKTCFMIDLLLRAAQNGIHCLGINTEMDRSSVAQRQFNIGYQIGNLEYSSKGQLAQMYAKFLVNKDLRIVHFMDAVGADISAIESGIAEWQWRVGEQGGLVMVDYIQNITNQGYGNSHTLNYERIRDVSRRLKTIAVRYNVAMVVLAQLNNPNQNGRANNSEVDVFKRPNLFDIGGSSAIVQDAGLVLTLYKSDDSIESTRRTQDDDDNIDFYSYTNKASLSDEKPIRMDIVKSRYGKGAGETIELHRSLGGGFYSSKTPALIMRGKV